MQHRVLAIVKTEAIPGRMFASCPRIKIQIAVAVNSGETLCFILHGMRVHYIHYDSDAQAMGLIYESLEIIGCAEA